MLSRVLAVVGAVTILPVTMAAGPPIPGHCAVVDGAGLCLVAAADPARRGGPAEPRRRSGKPVPARSSPTGRLNPNPGPSVTAMPIIGIGGAVGWTLTAPPQFPGIGAPPAGPAAAAAVPPAPAVLARRAVELLGLPRPAPQISIADRAYVGMPIWLWIAGGSANVGPVSATATAGTAQVTATARLTRTEWSMGPAGDVVRCSGPGTPWAGEPGPSPDCGYVYSERSLPGRTGGSGRWTVTVTAVWDVTWNGVSGGVPIAGAQVVQLVSSRPVSVGELQVLVTGGDS